MYAPKSERPNRYIRPAGFLLKKTGGCSVAGYCLAEARATQIAGGWIDEDCTIWDSEGRLVVQARQLARLSRGR